MTDTTDTKALREECAQWVKDTIGEAVDTRMALNGDGNDYMSWDMSVIWLAWLHLSGKLEAERQRADEDGRKNTLLYVAMKLRAEKTESELAALKGDQEPVALIDGRPGSRGFCLTQRGQRLNLQHGTELFTAPHKPVVLPQRYSLDGWPCVNDSREWMDVDEVIAAIEAAGGIVKDGE